MSGLFFGLEVGKRALLSQQLALNTSGHNIANAATPGYSRQRVDLASTYPFFTPQGVLGTGVGVRNVLHVRDLFLGAQWRNDNGNLARWQTTNKTLAQVESFYNEPSDKGLGQLIGEFWNAWENLATNPTARTAVVEKTRVMLNGFHEHAKRLTELRRSLDSDIKNRVMEINELSGQIANLNKQIANFELGTSQANDLRDRRDLLIDQLSSIAQVRTYARGNGTVTVHIGSMALVDGVNHLRIATKTVARSGSEVTTAVWENTNFEIAWENGELFALQELRDRTIPQQLADLDALAAAIVTQVNQVHSAGVGANGSTGINFFDPFRLTAGTIALNVDLENDLNLIAASLSGEPGDTRNAQAISELRYGRVMLGNTATINEFYAGLVGAMGIRTKEAETLKENYSLLVTQLDNARQSVQGVSLDEEVTMMIKYQRAYEAAARMITFIDSALQTVISGMGVTR